MSGVNRQNIVASFIWAAAMLTVMLIAGIKYHASVILWIIGIAVFLGGVMYNVILYLNDGEETIAPYVVQTIGAMIVIIGAAA